MHVCLWQVEDVSVYSQQPDVRFSHICGFIMSFQKTYYSTASSYFTRTISFSSSDGKCFIGLVSLQMKWEEEKETTRNESPEFEEYPSLTAKEISKP